LAALFVCFWSKVLRLLLLLLLFLDKFNWFLKLSRLDYG